MAVAAMLEEIDRFCTDEKQLVTYQWLSRKLNVPSDTSKRCALDPTVCRPPPARRPRDGCVRRCARVEGCSLAWAVRTRAAGCWPSTPRPKVTRSSRCSSYLAGPRAAAGRTALRSSPARMSTVRQHPSVGSLLQRG
jgi:hypothetical protein